MSQAVEQELCLWTTVVVCTARPPGIAAWQRGVRAPWCALCRDLLAHPPARGRAWNAKASGEQLAAHRPCL